MPAQPRPGGSASPGRRATWVGWRLYEAPRWHPRGSTSFETQQGSKVSSLSDSRVTVRTMPLRYSGAASFYFCCHIWPFQLYIVGESLEIIKSEFPPNDKKLRILTLLFGSNTLNTEVIVMINVTFYF